ncbi:hypothetical protein FIBSPDRAFT_859422 [Athelia psychrophila]|uniref:Uncharacterized protein n=1 Tax=Athelia psychrophila TaxID=1759441 RepID=A0A165XY49_9AGAM|nr:hypothetical protein FIBSPDRAFT_873971 [Fibularhizoctonia sp. CBS 109695]KZP22665.1 hypothetical protein FIBSPDRAFT_859422 [Fibularhizoctonia sp. CBS 109695]
MRAGSPQSSSAPCSIRVAHKFAWATTAKGEYVDIIKEGIVDPLKVALVGASGVVSLSNQRAISHQRSSHKLQYRTPKGQHGLSLSLSHGCHSPDPIFHLRATSQVARDHQHRRARRNRPQTSTTPPSQSAR